MKGRRLPLLRVVRRALRLVWRAARRELLMAVALEVVVAVALAVTLLAGRELVAELTGGEAPAMQGVLGAVVVLGVSLIVSGVCQVAVREIRTLISEKTVQATEEEIVSVATSVGYQRYEEAEFHDLAMRANAQATQASYRIVSNLLSLFSVVGTSVAVVGVLVSSVPAVLPALALVAIPFAAAARFSAQLGFRVNYALTTPDRLRSYLYRTLTEKRPAKELRIFGLSRFLRARWSELYRDRVAELGRLARKRILLNGVAAMASSALVAAVLIVMVDAAIDERIGLADAAVAIVALQQLALRIRTATTATGSLRGAALFLDDFGAFMSMRGDDESSLAPQPYPAAPISVEDVSFTYPGTDVQVLDDVSLTIEPGEVVALVGVSGGGKTTLANLIASLYEPTSGEILFGETPISELDRARYRRSLGVVFQEFERYEMTALENITLSNADRVSDRTEAARAAARAGIETRIDELPGGYDTLLSRNYEGGSDLSVGEWQRIAIARAFFRDAPVLILDEPAAALDAVAEQELVERLRSLVADRSVLMISHRFSTVRMADRILVMAEGKIAEEGTHAELLAQGGRYADLFSMQAKGYLPDQVLRGEVGGS